MFMSQSLFIALSASVVVVVAFLEWQILRRIHRRTLSSMRTRYRTEARVAGEMLSQCRRQIGQLKSELSNANALSARRSFQVVGNSPASREIDVFSNRPHPPAAFADTVLEEADRRIFG